MFSCCDAKFLGLASLLNNIYQLFELFLSLFVLLSLFVVTKEESLKKWISQRDDLEVAALEGG